MKCDTGLLRAYLDDAMPAAERSAVVAHLAVCAGCHSELARLQEQSNQVAARLTALEPGPEATPSPALALAQFHAQAPAARPSVWDTVRGGWETMKTSFWGRQWRPVSVGVTAVLCLAILFSFAPVRQAAADFLGIFRVRKFAVIPVDSSKVSQLEGLAQMAEAGQFGQPTFTREPGPGQTVADTSEAARVAGFAVRAPTSLPDAALLWKVSVETGPAIHYEMDRAAMQAILDATGIANAKLPDAERLVFDVDVPKIVVQEFGIGIGAGTLTLTQLPSPEINVPQGVDPAALGEIAFQFLGMAPEDARRLAQTIDWGSTVVIPLPTDVASYREVTVDGVTGLLIEEKRASSSRGANAVLLWQRDGMVYSLNAVNVDSKVVLQVADSLK